MQSESIRRLIPDWRDPASRIAAAVVALVSALALALSISLAPRALGFALADDALFVRLAQNIANGEWLGAYDELTLVKGAFYPIFLAIAHTLSLPLLVAQQLAAIVAAGVMTATLYRMGLGRVFSLILFTLLALSPLAWHPDLVRVTREPLYTSLSLLTFAFAALSFDANLGKRERLVALACLGSAFAMFWLTREESVWLYPALAMLALIPAIGIGFVWRKTGYRMNRAREGATLVAMQAVALLLPFALIAGGVAAMNAVHYGSFLSNEVREGDMADAYGALLRIKDENQTPRMFFAAGAAAKAYEVSEAARELKPTLEGERGEFWRRISCEALALDPCPSGFGGGWFMWAFREAVREAGHLKDSPTAQAFFEKLAAEINTACDENKIACGPEHDSMAPPLTPQAISALPTRASDAIALLLRFGFGDVGMQTSEGDETRLKPFRDVVGDIAPTLPTTQKLLIEGWVAAPECVAAPAVTDISGAQASTAATLSEAPDVVEVLRSRGQEANARRFKIETACTADTCRFQLIGCGATAEGTPVSALKKGASPALDRSVVFFDRVETVAIAAAANGTIVPEGPAGRMMRTIAWVYSSIMPFAYAASLLMFALALARMRRVPLNPALVAVALAALIALVSRALLIAAIDVTSWNAVNIQYMSPAAPFALIFVVVAVAMGVAALRPQTPTAASEQN